MKTVTTLLIIAILFFATVIGWTYFTVRGEGQNTQPQVGIGGGPEVSQDTNYRVSFLKLLPEHANLAVTHLTNVYDEKDTSETTKLLETNSQKLSDVMRQLGTPTDKEIFQRMFRGHISEYENYTNAKKENNQAGMNTAKENLSMHAMEFGEITHKLMPSIAEQRATELMSDHVGLTIAIIDAHAEGNTSEKLNKMKDANLQVATFANELATAAEKSPTK